MQFPPALRPRDRVRIVAPSGPFDRTLALVGAGFLGRRYRVELDFAMFQKHGFLAGPDARRRAELEAALGDPGVRAVVAARGGYGLTRILHATRSASLARDPKWVVGFSDVTALHVECARLGIASIHAHNCAGLGRGDARARAEFLDVLERPKRRRHFGELETWRSGHADGVLAGGNLTLAAAGRLSFRPMAPSCSRGRRSGLSPRPDVDGVARRWRARPRGRSSWASSRIAPADPTVSRAERAVRERLDELQIPVLAGLDAGHGQPNLPLVFGAPARIGDGALTLFPEA
ncbi:MAG: LD-carboxypeptidase [Polyangiaceae bacterium]